MHQSLQLTARRHTASIMWLSSFALLLLIVFFSLLSKTAQAGNAEPGYSPVTCIATGAALADADPARAVLLNGLLSSLGGETVDLTPEDYSSLLAGSVDLDDFLRQLQVDVGVGTPGDVLTANVSLQQIVAAAAAVSSGPEAVAALTVLSDSVNLPTQSVVLGDFLQIAPTVALLGNVTLNPFDLVVGSFQLFSEQNVAGTNTPVTISAAALGLTNVGDITLRTHVLEAPRYSCGTDGIQFSAAAMRLGLDIDGIDVSDSSSVPVVAALEATIGQASLYVDVASGAGAVTFVDSLAASVQLQATPGVTRLYLGSFASSDFFTDTAVDVNALQPAIIGSVLVTPELISLSPITLTITARSVVTGVPSSQGTVVITGPFPASKVITSSTDFVTNLLDSLIDNTELAIDSSLLPVALNPVLAPVAALVEGLFDNAAAPVLNDVLRGVADPLLENVGVSLGAINVDVLEVGQVLLDSDGDGINDEFDPDDNNACVPNPAASACQALKVFLPAVQRVN